MSEAKTPLCTWLEHIEKCHPLTIEMGLERITEVARRGDLLNFNCPVITVAGTNGKGSTVAILSKLLNAAGLKVGTYTSPHLVRFNERIQLAGQCVTDEQLCAVFERVEALRGQTPLTFFEFTSLAAFAFFQSYSDLDVLILEIGLGGRFDAVNALDPNLAIVTSIGYDHEEWLGNTLQAIAKEKAGIFRPHIPVILSRSACIDTLFQEADKNANTLYIEGEHFDFINATGTQWYFDKLSFELSNHSLPTNSVSLALAAYTVLGRNGLLLPKISEVIDSIHGLMMMGRFQVLNVCGITSIFDVAHNQDGSCWLAQRLQEKLRSRKLFAIWASLADKSLPEIIRPLKGLVHTWCIGALRQVKRAQSVAGLYQVLCDEGITNVLQFSSISKAYEETLKMATKEDSIVVFGSFYTVSQVLQTVNVDDHVFQNNGLCRVHEQHLFLRDQYE